MVLGFVGDGDVGDCVDVRPEMVVDVVVCVMFCERKTNYVMCCPIWRRREDVDVVVMRREEKMCIVEVAEKEGGRGI